MSRTSSLQIEVMIDFMERNGDLNKFADGPNDRIFAINRWQEVASILNLDKTVTSKPVDKWKKRCGVTSKIIQSEKHPRSTKLQVNRLTDLEEQVLSIIGCQAATGLVNVQEFGLERWEIGTSLVEAASLHHIPRKYWKLLLLPPHRTMRKWGLSDGVIHRRRSTPRRSRARPTRVDAASQQFIVSDERWRNLVVVLPLST